MIKLSDKKAEYIIIWHSGLDQGKYHFIQGAVKETRDYYDAQIDTQAKTMEELYKLFYDTCDKKSEEWYISEKLIYPYPMDAEYIDAKIFSQCVGFFLAAGGTIKE